MFDYEARPNVLKILPNLININKATYKNHKCLAYVPNLFKIAVIIEPK